MFLLSIIYLWSSLGLPYILAIFQTPKTQDSHSGYINWFTCELVTMTDDNLERLKVSIV